MTVQVPILLLTSAPRFHPCMGPEGRRLMAREPGPGTRVLPTKETKAPAGGGFTAPRWSNWTAAAVLPSGISGPTPAARTRPGTAPAGRSPGASSVTVVVKVSCCSTLSATPFPLESVQAMVPTGAGPITQFIGVLRRMASYRVYLMTFAMLDAAFDTW